MTTKPKVIAFRPSEFKPYWVSLGIDKIDNSDHWPVELLVCYSFAELGAALLEKPVLIMVAKQLINQYTTVEEFIIMLETMFKCNNLDPAPAIGIGFCAITTLEEINEIKKTSAVGIFPSIIDFGIDELYICLNNFLENKKVYPRHLIDQLPRKNKKDIALPKGLTIRQQQVYDLITQRGLSNKQIAKHMKISECTVKLHVGSVMRHYRVSNRTQLIALTRSPLKY